MLIDRRMGTEESDVSCVASNSLSGIYHHSPLFMTAELRVAAYLADCYQRNFRWNELRCMGMGSMHGWDEIENLGREIGAKHWTRSAEWPGASFCGWGSNDEREPEYERAYETTELGDGSVEVVVECRHSSELKDTTIYRLRAEEGEWRILNEFEVGNTAPPFERYENPQVKQIRTKPRPLHLGVFCPPMDGLMKPAIRLHAVRDDTVTDFDSHLGGPFLANDPATWPRCECHETPLFGGVQIWRRGLVPRPIEIQGELFPDRIIPPKGSAGIEFPSDFDVLQIFWCPFYHPYEEAAHHLRWLNSSKVAATHAANPPYRQPSPVEGMVPKPCRLHAEWYPDYPDLLEAHGMSGWPDLAHALRNKISFDAYGKEDEGCISIESVNDFYAENLGAVHGTKWGGYACWIQDPQFPMCKCGTRMQLLLTVASSFDPTIDRLPAMVESDQPVQWDDQLCMGDVGSVYYFMCPRYPCGTQYKAIFQCS
jgi:hypothetical protein